MGVESAVKGGVSAAKSHWIFFLLLTVVLVGLALKYDRKNGGAIGAKLAGLPLVGRFFA
jgi:hypothetical protein